MQISNNADIFAIQNTYQNSYSSKSQPIVSKGQGDTLNISSEARAMYEQSLLDEQEKLSKAQSYADAMAQSLIGSSTSEEEDTELTLSQEFSAILDKHRTSSSGGDGAKSGGGSSTQSSADVIEQLEKQIQQVSSELASISGQAVNTGDVAANARVEQLQTELTQLESQLAQAQEAAATES